MKYSIGIDIGGMSIKFGLVNDEGKIVCRRTVVTDKNIGKAIKDMADKVNEILDENNLTIKDVNGVGIGCPGAVDNSTGTIVCLPNLGWENYPFVKELKKYLDTEIRISNDVNVATLGEWKYGSAKDCNIAVMYAIGTGVGSGFIIDKKLFEGGFSRGAEMGHITLIADGLDCTCGRKGCMECYTSATALIRQTKEEMIENPDSKMWDYAEGKIENVNGKTAFETSKLGDESANKVVNQFIKYLGEGILNALNVFRPEVLIIGGGISAQGSYLIDKLVDYCEKFEYGYHGAPKTKIVAATLGNDAGIIGASALLD